MSDQRQITKEDFLRLLNTYSNDIRKCPEPTQEAAARTVTSSFTEEDWKAWKATSGFLFSEAWEEWVDIPAGFIKVVNVASAFLPQSYETKLLYQIAAPNSHADDNVAYTDSQTGRTVGYRRKQQALNDSGMPAGCKYLGHVYGEDTEVHSPSNTF